MKAILISIKPQHVANILNGIKTLEIRRKFPIDYVGWVYIYCAKDNKQRLYPVALLDKSNHVFKRAYREDKIDNRTNYLNGKVVARFWCDKVEEIKRIYPSWDTKIFAWETETLAEGEIENKACLSSKELRNYLAFKENGYAIHITKLEIFDKPKEISEFYNYCKDEKCEYRNNHCSICRRESLNRAPQSWCYIEI